MNSLIVVAGSAGNLGGRIAAALIAREARLRALVRPGTPPEKLDRLRRLGAEIVAVDYADPAALEAACAGASCVVSALQGLRDVIVGGQGRLLDAAVAPGVPRFIPSIYAANITKVPDEENRNFAWGGKFRQNLLARRSARPRSSTACSWTCWAGACRSSICAGTR